MSNEQTREVKRRLPATDQDELPDDLLLLVAERLSASPQEIWLLTIQNDEFRRCLNEWLNRDITMSELEGDYRLAKMGELR